MVHRDKIRKNCANVQTIMDFTVSLLHTPPCPLHSVSPTNTHLHCVLKLKKQTEISPSVFSLQW